MRTTRPKDSWASLFYELISLLESCAQSTEILT